MFAFSGGMFHTPPIRTIKIGEANMKQKLLAVLTAICLSGAVLCAQDVSKDVDKAAKDTEHATKTAAKDTEKAADKTGKATEKAAKKTGHAVKKGTKTAGHDVKAGAEKTEDKMK